MAGLRHAALAAATAAMLASACAPVPQRAGIPTEWRPSPNFNERRPNYVVIHYTSDRTAEESLRTLTSPVLEVSAHYLVGRDGRIYQLVDERARAWHAGVSRWGGDTDINSSSIGIELDNDGKQPFPGAQIDALLRLLADLRERYRIPAANVLGHSDVAPRRKVDPGRLFPWKRLADQGFGLWCDTPLPIPPMGFDPAMALAAIGYDVSDPQAAIGAFRLHFAPNGQNGALDESEQALLACLQASKAAARE
jgi:N-acetylmuramoyl-L-alanine amidase